MIISHINLSILSIRDTTNIFLKIFNIYTDIIIKHGINI